MSQILHFKVDASLYNDIVRTAYWFEEGRKKWALEVLRCLEGITFEQERSFLMGDCIFENSEDSVMLVNKEDKEFKKELQDYFFGDGEMKVPSDDLERANFSGWLTREGFFIRCIGGEHIDLSRIICEKLDFLKDIHSRNYERILELNGAIKITSGTVLFESINLITGKQVEILTNYIDEGGELNSGGLNKKMSKGELLDWLGKKIKNVERK